MSDNLYVAKSDAALQAALNRFQIAVEDLAFIGTIPVEEAAGRAARQAIIEEHERSRALLEALIERRSGR